MVPLRKYGIEMTSLKRMNLLGPWKLQFELIGGKEFAEIGRVIPYRR
jgi:hypothetical protein